MAPLVCTMPGDLWSLEELPHSTRRPEKHLLKFVRPPVPADYVRFIPYAWRVKCLSNDLTAQFSRAKQIRTHPEVLSTLESFRPSVHLLPHIKELSLTLTKYTVGPVRVLLSPKLEKLSYSIQPTRDKATKTAIKQDTMQLFQKLGRVCPNLTQLTLDCSMRSKELRHELANTLSNLPYLILFVLKKPSVDIPILRALSLLSNLRVMVIDYIIGDEEWAGLPLRVLSFETLGMLNLNTDSMDAAYNLLHSINSPILQAVGLEVSSPASRSLVEKVFTEFATRHQDLRYLKLVLPCAEADPPQEILTPDTLRPLLKVKELITVDLHGCPIALDDRFVLRCADAWPKITGLRLGVRHGLGEPCSTVSLSALVPFVHKCPSLRLLGLPLDPAPVALAREMRNIPPSLCGGHSQHQLETLQVGQVAITDVPMVAGFLSGLFPGLLCIDPACSEDELESDEEEEDGETRMLNADRWEAVMDEIPDFAAVRRQERAWGQAQGKRFLKRDKTCGPFGLTPQALRMVEQREQQR
ncbi:hypothetical protein GSI_15338 [Ganoderma sinense ZZ0214-1]|uniref:Uncharacterized protein n=1 Tax=Ganoderma sinense ZZ0214-1 TaxID=1077348 RepID=A0A2G8RMA5_9APHY|nr:hypothetical protein GSI_15338 [Ganoderma sinense ZZ0214-1]